MGTICYHLVVKERVVVVHQTVFFLDLKGIVVDIDVGPRDVLQDYAHAVGVLRKMHLVFESASGRKCRRQLDVGHCVIEPVEALVGDCLVALAGAVERTGQCVERQGIVGAAAGNGEVLFSGSLVVKTGPGHEMIFSCGEVNLHRIVIGSETCAALGFLPHEFSLRVESVETDRFYFVGESVGPLHVHVVGKLHSVAYGAVALVIVNDTVTRLKRQAHHGGCNRGLRSVFQICVNFVHIRLNCIVVTWLNYLYVVRKPWSGFAVDCQLKKGRGMEAAREGAPPLST